MITLALSGCAVLVSAIMLKYHSEARYRFAAACLSVGGWVAAASVALPEHWRCRHLDQEIKALASTNARHVDTTEDVTLVGITPGGNIIEVHTNGVRVRTDGSEQRGTVSRWGGARIGSGDGSVFTGSTTPVRGITGSRGL